MVGFVDGHANVEGREHGEHKGSEANVNVAQSERRGSSLTIPSRSNVSEANLNLNDNENLKP